MPCLFALQLPLFPLLISHTTILSPSSRSLPTLSRLLFTFSRLSYTHVLPPTPSSLYCTPALPPTPASLSYTTVLPPTPASLSYTPALLPTPASLSYTPVLLPTPTFSPFDGFREFRWEKFLSFRNFEAQDITEWKFTSTLITYCILYFIATVCINVDPVLFHLFYGTFINLLALERQLIIQSNIF